MKATPGHRIVQAVVGDDRLCRLRRSDHDDKLAWP